MTNYDRIYGREPVSKYLFDSKGDPALTFAIEMYEYFGNLEKNKYSGIWSKNMERDDYKDLSQLWTKFWKASGYVYGTLSGMVENDSKDYHNEDGYRDWFRSFKIVREELISANSLFLIALPEAKALVVDSPKLLNELENTRVSLKLMVKEIRDISTSASKSTRRTAKRMKPEDAWYKIVEDISEMVGVSRNIRLMVDELDERFAIGDYSNSTLNDLSDLAGEFDDEGFDWLSELAEIVCKGD